MPTVALRRPLGAHSRLSADTDLWVLTLQRFAFPLKQTESEFAFPISNLLIGRLRILRSI